MKSAPDRDQETPQRDVVRHAGESDGAEEDRLEVSKTIEAVLGHHAAGFRVALAAPVERRPFDLESEPPTGGVEDAHALGHDFLADSIAGNRRDAMLHRSPPCTLIREKRSPSVSRKRFWTHTRSCVSILLVLGFSPPTAR